MKVILKGLMECARQGLDRRLLCHHRIASHVPLFLRRLEITKKVQKKTTNGVFAPF